MPLTYDLTGIPGWQQLPEDGRVSAVVHMMMGVGLAKLTTTDELVEAHARATMLAALGTPLLSLDGGPLLGQPLMEVLGTMQGLRTNAPHQSRSTWLRSLEPILKEHARTAYGLLHTEPEPHRGSRA